MVKDTGSDKVDTSGRSGDIAYSDMVGTKVNKGTHVFMNSGDAAKQRRDFDGKFYVSSERISGDNPYRSWFTSKAWPLIENLELFIINFQEVIFLQ